MPDFITKHDIFMILGSVAVLVCCYLTGEIIRRLFGLTGSFSRKFIHIAIAIWACAVYFIFEHKEMAVVLPVLFCTANISPIRSRIFRISGIEDTFHPGMLYYPISLFFLLWFCWDEQSRWAGIVSLLNLGLGDSAAWIIGSRYGKLQYRVGESKKSYAGTAAMMVICIICVTAVILITSSPLDMRDIVAILAISAGATLLEAVCSNGLDNICVPLGSALIYSFFYQ
ncbi:MAG: hypothetical protein RBU23_03985 [Candidatus Auribacterota bacterium]|jgi:phytol kinase|nr:hypothetical protein [Candidatus Auribacterota bacterium]